MTRSGSQKPRSTARRIINATPVSVPAGLAVLVTLTDPQRAMPPAVTWTVLAVLGVLIVGDLVCGGLWLAAHRRA